MWKCVCLDRECDDCRSGGTRDQLAMAALIALVSGRGYTFLDYDDEATEAYEMADAMLKARVQNEMKP
jgi:hypothetical protein